MFVKPVPIVSTTLLLFEIKRITLINNNNANPNSTTKGVAWGNETGVENGLGVE